MDSFSERIQMLSVQMVPFIVAVVFHEFAHGFVAYKWGDSTAKDQGRLTLNPIPHIDVVGTLVFPMINMLSGMNLLFGWAKPVPIDPRRFRKLRPGLFWVSVAGPSMNFFLAVASAFLFCLLELYLPKDFYLHEPLMRMTVISVSLNYALGIFNLIPLPPLDGSKMIEAFLPLKLALKYERLTQFSFFILMVLLLSGALNILGYPIRFMTELTLYSMTRAFGM